MTPRQRLLRAVIYLAILALVILIANNRELNPGIAVVVGVGLSCLFEVIDALLALYEP